MLHKTICTAALLAASFALGACSTSTIIFFGPDAGSGDAGLVDAGEPIDAGGPVDAGQPVDAGPLATSLSLAPASAQTVLGGTVSFIATASYADGHSDHVTAQASWSLSDPDGTIGAGVARSTTAGSWVVTALYAGLSAEASLQVGLQQAAFISSAQGTGNLASWASSQHTAGLAGADLECQALATAAGLIGTYRAWLSDSSNDAYCRVHGLSGTIASNCGQTALPAVAGPWVATDLTPFGARIDLMLAGQIDYPLRLDERGKRVADQESIWTGTGEDGVSATAVATPGSPCLDWAAATGDEPFSSRVGSTSFRWTVDSSLSCEIPAHLICLAVSGAAGAALPLPAVSGKQAFITSEIGDANLSTWPGSGGQSGLAAGDAICQSLAAAQNLVNADRFKVWLSTSQIDAIDRFTSDGPWVRADGAVIAMTRAELVSGDLRASIAMDEQGHYAADGELRNIAWTGSDPAGRKEGAVCNDWTDDTPESSDNAIAGLADDATSYWTTFAGPNNRYNCADYLLPLYCLEDD